MSTPTSLELPDRARRTTVSCARGTFAALEAFPASGTCELGTALLVPGYTGSKEDFIPLLGPLAAAGRRVVAIDMRGQYQTPGPDDPAAYHWPALAADITAVAKATDTTHLLGHSFGGLVTREAVLAGYTPASLTLMSSGPSALPGPRAEDLRAMLAYLDGTPTQDLKAKIEEIWHAALEPQAIDSGVTPEILAFLKDRMLTNNPTALVTMASNLLTAGDKTKALARPRHPDPGPLRRRRQRLAPHGASRNGHPPRRPKILHPRRSTQPQRRSPGNHSPRPDKFLDVRGSEWRSGVGDTASQERPNPPKSEAGTSLTEQVASLGPPPPGRKDCSSSTRNWQGGAVNASCVVSLRHDL